MVLSAAQIASTDFLSSFFSLGPSTERRVLKHLTTKIATREVLGYSQLQLAESAYDNAYLLPLISGRFFGRSLFLLVVNFILQYCIAYLLWTRTSLTATQLREKLFGSEGGRGGVCWYPDANSNRVIMCTPDEVFFASDDFSFLDWNQDGDWTFEEALLLDRGHHGSNKRRLNMTEVYKNIIYKIRDYAGPRVLGCDIGERIEAFDQNTGFWRTAWVWNITSTDNVVVTYFNPPTNVTSDKAYINKKYTRKKVGSTIYACSIPACVDMDSGATDTTDATCADYNGYDACGGNWDDADFKVMELCCTCGGGSRSPQLTGYGHLPVGLALEEVSQLQPFRSCMQKANLPSQQDECIINFTSIPRYIYENQIQPFAKYCYLPDTDTCSNLKARGQLPPVNITPSSTVPLFFKMADISHPVALQPESVCQKAVSKFCPAVMTFQTTLFQEERTEVCGKKIREIQEDQVLVSYEASKIYDDPAFGLTSAVFQGFLFLIVFLWGLASVAEFRSILIWWNVLLAQPSSPSVQDCLQESWEENGDDVTLEVIGITRKFRLLSIFLNLLPRSTLQCLIFFVGIQYLLSVRKLEDLILNSLALTFLVTVDEMLFAAFAGEQNAAWIQETKPIRGRSFKCVDWVLAVTHIPLGMFMFFPILIWLSYYLVRNKIETDGLADATYCLCDLKGTSCFIARNVFPWPNAQGVSLHWNRYSHCSRNSKIWNFVFPEGKSLHEEISSAEKTPQRDSIT